MPGCELKDVFFQRDNLQDRLKWAHVELAEMEKKLAHF